jgi:hypothetical protein
MDYWILSVRSSNGTIYTSLPGAKVAANQTGSTCGYLKGSTDWDIYYDTCSKWKVLLCKLY